MKSSHTLLLMSSVVCLLLLGGSRVALPAPSTPFLVVVQGLGGEPFYEQLFSRNSEGLIEIAQSRWGLADTNILWLRPNPTPGQRESSRDQILAALDDVAARSASGDRVMLVYFGHISAQGTVPKLNLPGPDLTDSTLAKHLAMLSGRQLAVVLSAASSGAMLPTLSAPSRIVVTATASGREKYVPRFGEFFVNGWIAPQADSDKDGVVNLYDDFEYTRRAVRKAFEGENRLLTEHALLDDNGDGHSSKKVRISARSREQGSELDDGAYARRFSFQFDDARRLGSAAELTLSVRARQLAQAVESLRRERAQMSPQAYQQKLESLLVELALNRRRLRETLRR